MSRAHIQFRGVIADIDQKKSGWHFPDQLIIRVWKWCNFRCAFCNVAENEKVLSIKASLKEILAITFRKILHSNLTSGRINVTVSWGEPSIFQAETIFVLRYFRKYFEKRGITAQFDIQTNASNIDQRFSEILKQEWVVQALVSTHAHDPDIYKKIIGVPYETLGKKAELGIRNLIECWIPVSLNIVMNWVNADHYFEHIQYLVASFPEIELYNLGMMQPHWMAQKNLEELYLPYEKGHHQYNRAIHYLKWIGKRVHSHLVGPPVCYMDDVSSSLEYLHNRNIFREWPQSQTLIQDINDDNKTHTSACRMCRAKRVCSGTWKEYADKQTLHPIPTGQFLISSKWCHIFENKAAAEKLYSQGIREVFILGKDSNQIIDDIATVKNIWYESIILVDTFENVKNPSDISWVTIQSWFEDMKKYGLQKLLHIERYNRESGFQFQIDSDVHIPYLSSKEAEWINQHPFPSIVYHVHSWSHEAKMKCQNRSNIVFWK